MENRSELKKWKKKGQIICLGLSKSKGCTQGTIFLLIFCLLVLSITKRNVEVSYYNLDVSFSFQYCQLLLCAFWSSVCHWVQSHLGLLCLGELTLLSTCMRAKSLQSCPTLLRPYGLQHSRLPCSRHSPGKNTGVGPHFLFQGIFPIQGSNLGLRQCALYH